MFGKNPLVVFTKPWKTESLEALADRVAGLGFQGIELPVRDGYQVSPGNIHEKLPEAARTFAGKNLRVFNVAGEINESFIRGLGESGVGTLRVMLNADPKRNYLEQEEEYYRKVSALLPVLEANKVRLGIQNHFGNFIGCSAAGLMRFVSRFPVKQVGAVLDLAHCAIAGEITEFALDIAASHMIMVNLKNGYRRRTNFSTAADPEWRTVWTSSHQGALSWKLAVSELKKRGYEGPICITAEYSGTEKPLEGEEVMTLLREDAAYYSSLL